MERAISEIIRIDREARQQLQKAEEERKKILAEGEARRRQASEKAAALREEKLSAARAEAETVLDKALAKEKEASVCKERALEAAFDRNHEKWEAEITGRLTAL